MHSCLPKPRSKWHKLPSTNGLPRNMFLPFCRLPLSSSLRLSLDWYYRSPRGRVYSTLKQQGRLPWIFASVWFVFRVSGIFYLIWHDVIPLTLLLAKALIISAASFMLILPLDKIEDSAKPRLCQRLVLSASKCENGIDMVRLPGCWSRIHLDPLGSMRHFHAFHTHMSHRYPRSSWNWKNFQESCLHRIWHFLIFAS